MNESIKGQVNEWRSEFVKKSFSEQFLWMKSMSEKVLLVKNASQ